MIRQVFNLRLRQTEGFVISILKIMNIDLEVLDYTTLARRVRGLKVDFVANKPRGSNQFNFRQYGYKSCRRKRVDET
jgi:hypothetical protein